MFTWDFNAQGLQSFSIGRGISVDTWLMCSQLKRFRRWNIGLFKPGIVNPQESSLRFFA